MKKKFYIENLGCAKNQVDAEVIAFNLTSSGYEQTDEASEADYIIVNTCGFINSAKEESINVFFRLRDECPDAKIVVSGCLAQRYSQTLVSDMPEAECVFGNRDLSKITEVVSQLEDGKRNFRLCPEYRKPEEEDDRRSRLFGFPGAAYLKISEGCNHCCSYCAIPLIRGSLRSRPIDKIIGEAVRLVASGIKEINLIAQDLAAYGWDWDSKSHFCELLDILNAVEGNFRIRLLYIHPDWMTQEIIDCVKRNKKVLHYFDIPFQHASASVLSRMNRTGNENSYAELIEKIRTEMPDAVIRTTLMLGFPGDSKEDFEILKKFVKRCRFNWMGSFVYSLEEDTPAWDMTTEEKHEKLASEALKWQKSLQKIQEKITSEMLETFVGNEYDVLIEELVEGEEMAIGRIYSQAPEVDGLTVVMGRGMKPGCIYRCGITKVNGIDLEAVKIG